MSSLKPNKSIPSNNKFLQALQRLGHLQHSSKSKSQSLDCGLLKSLQEIDDEHYDDSGKEKRKIRRRRSIIAIDAFAGKLFAGVSSVKAAYAELQAAQSPYDGGAIRLADEAVVKELTLLSDLKRHGFLNKEEDPHVDLLLSEIREQQSLIKTYIITSKSLRSQIEIKNSKISSLKSELEHLESKNINSEKKLAASELQVLQSKNIYSEKKLAASEIDLRSELQDLQSKNILNLSNFARILSHTIKSVRSFVKILIRQMQFLNWNIESAASAAVHGDGEFFEFVNGGHVCFAFESFVAREMFEGFNRSTFSLPPSIAAVAGGDHLTGFKLLKGANAREFMESRQGAEFSAFVRVKYLNLVNPKMERCLFGGLEQRYMVSSGGLPQTEFFMFFVEMAKRVWLLHRLAYSIDESPGIFMAGRTSRFSETFMESVNGPEFLSLIDPRVAFTVQPGFQICKTVFQCLVYISPPPSS